MSTTEEQIQSHYAEVPYRLGAFPQTHPARLAVLARLMGLPAPDPRSARVLELGCAQGYNLLPLAAGLPGASFTGVDLSPPQIAEGRELIAAAGLGNIALRCADLRTFTPEAGSFDYIIAHGLFSWVPDEAKEAILALCARALSPNGLAFISYNTYPGWKQRESIRDLLGWRLRGIPDAPGRLAAADQTLAFFEAALTGKQEPSSVFLLGMVTGMRRKSGMVFQHDELETINDPCYFLQFMEWAGEHGLQYVGDASFASSLLENLPPAAQTALARLNLDQLQLEQYLDFLRNRTFRSTLLCRAGPVLNPRLDLDALRGCVFASVLRPPVGLPNLREGVKVRFLGPAGHPGGLESAAPWIKAMLTVLADAWPRRVPFSELAIATSRLCATVRCELGPAEETAMLRCLLDGLARQSADALVDCGLDTTTAPGTAWDRLRGELSRRRLPVANAWHEPGEVTSDG